MPEIKSTLDLIMEKTEGLTLTDEEKQAAAREEHLEKVPGYAQRFLDGLWSAQRMQEELDGLPPAVRGEAAQRLAMELLEALDLQERDARCLEALELLASETDRAQLDALKQIFEEHQRSKAEWKRSQEKKMTDELAEAGIRGDAVVVRPEKTGRWLKQQSRLRDRLHEIRNHWRSRLEAR